ncbi:MAG: aminotransferase class V-fold PLP-dependent enzyme [Acidobacteria bacterium]|nr:aminotransferase class V-fold PLP-dependent enzyme [Acidobacteriota bacterium]
MNAHPCTSTDPLGELLAQFPEYAKTSVLDELRRTDYARLDAHGHAYLDYTGGGVYADSQIRDHAALITAEALGNPHSVSLASTASTRLVERARRAVLDYFRAAGNYTAIFTLNASGALKLVGESFPFVEGSRFLLTFDNHNSVNGIREFARGKGATFDYVPITLPDLRLDMAALEAHMARIDRSVPNLFAFPAQSNFSGVKHPLDLVERAHAEGWSVLLDAAAFVPTNPLDLSAVRPDFVTISFYKMFGYPTGVGALLVRNDALPLLHRPWFAGGTVNFATVQGKAHILSPGEAGFEDGTLNYLGIPAVEIGLRHLERIGIDTIQTRVQSLAGWLLSKLLALRHANGRPMVRIYGPATMKARGATITMNFYDPDGHLIDYRRVEELAGERGISLRTGCFCNPGAGEAAEQLTEADMRAAMEAGDDMNLQRFVQLMQSRGGKAAGAIRVSFGLASNVDDAARFLAFAEELRDQTRLTLGDVSFDIESCRVIRDGA